MAEVNSFESQSDRKSVTSSQIGMKQQNQFENNKKPQWCAGCGDYAILMAVKNAYNELGLNPKDTVMVSGIGCNSKIVHYVNAYGYEGLHGRTLPLASGIKIANRKLKVLAFSGDGDGYGEGAQHFVHICRRNYDMTYIVHNNQLYGLTTGQASPTTEKGQKTKSTPFGVLETQFNPLASAITNGATYVARTFAGDLVHMKEIIKGAISHKGFSLVDIFQPCITFNQHNTYEWFRQRVYKLEETEYKQNDFFKAIEKSYEDVNTNYEKLPIGLFYKVDKPTYEGELPQLKEKELVEKDISKVGIEHLLKEFG